MSFSCASWRPCATSIATLSASSSFSGPNHHRLGGSVELEMLGFIDHSHSAFAELFEDFVVGYGLADHPLIVSAATVRQSSLASAQVVANGMVMRWLASTRILVIIR